MGKARLVPYDVEKLNKLVALYLLSADYRALPTMTVSGTDGQELQYGAGGEFIYHIPPKIMYALIFIDDPGAFSVLKLRGEAKAAALRERVSQDADNSVRATAYVARINRHSGTLTERRVMVDYEGSRMYMRERVERRWWLNQPMWVYVALALLAVATFVVTWVVMSIVSVTGS